MTTHIIAMTYAPKIEAVFNFDCQQTIRHLPKNPNYIKRIGDNALIHTWDGKPYRSKWGRRITEYLTDVFLLAITPGNRYVAPMKLIKEGLDIFPLSEKWVHLSIEDEHALLCEDDYFKGDALDLMRFGGHDPIKEIGIYQVLRWGYPDSYSFESPTAPDDMGI